MTFAATIEDSANELLRFFGLGEPIPTFEGSDDDISNFDEDRAPPTVEFAGDDLEDFDGRLIEPMPVDKPKGAPNPGDVSGLRIAGNATGLVAVALLGGAAFLLLRR